MFLALRELRFAKGRFALVGLVIGLIATLMVLLSGLATGLVDDGIAGLRALPATHIAFDADASFPSSAIERDTWEAMADSPGVQEAAPLGNTLFNARTSDDVPVDLALFGVEPDSFLAPAVAQGQPLGTNPEGVVIADPIAEQGVGIGDRITLDVVGADLTVIGIAPTGTYGHVPVIYAPLDVWQQASFGHTANAADRVSTVALQLADDGDPAALHAEHGTQTVTRSESFHSSPGYTEETQTMQMIQAALYLISVVRVGAFFVVWTVQRRQEIGVLKALGATDRLLLREALGQGGPFVLRCRPTAEPRRDRCPVSLIVSALSRCWAQTSICPRAQWWLAGCRVRNLPSSTSRWTCACPLLHAFTRRPLRRRARAPGLVGW